MICPGCTCQESLHLQEEYQEKMRLFMIKYPGLIKMTLHDSVLLRFRRHELQQAAQNNPQLAADLRELIPGITKERSFYVQLR